MAKKNYAVELPQANSPVTPFIFRVSEDGTGIIWRDAKKTVRQWYLDRAKELRTLSEAEFIKQEEVAIAQMVESGSIQNEPVSGAV